ncbi:Fic family protein [Deinococcus peraridilitoris]|uniref:Fido domain-containing protein n=1 Tax=Deinococcus peraridilitoris (strain DSM 19664 / LMG 22246 / CIP 109416 / KR-200) TaxID=937777 RepID=L0A0I4_DEIPD|nr:Fic family protein [Deinococcus peraridilitoris]AFZ66969.1 hypothetical protein Deipe_1428 [Deinococcus peraridilitoris DSM 19664]
MTYDPNIAFNVLPALPPPEEVITTEVYRQLNRATRALGELKGAGRVIPDQSVLISMIGLQEAKLSSEIENIVTTNDELYRAFADDGNADPATKEVLRYGQALWYAYDQIKMGRPLCTSLFEEIATTIKMVDIGVRKSPGTKIMNSLREIIYTPPDGEPLIRALLYDLEKFMNDDSISELDPLIKMAITHYQFEAIHPFSDGNGRTGRILNIIYLIDKGLLEIPVLYLSKYIIENKMDYYRGLKAVTEEGKWEDWIIYMLKAVESTSIITKSKIYRIEELINDTVQQVKSQSNSIYSKDLIEVIFRRPVFKIKFVEESLSVSRPTALKYLQTLVGNNVLMEFTHGKNKYYANSNFIDLLSE